MMVPMETCRWRDKSSSVSCQRPDRSGGLVCRAMKQQPWWKSPLIWLALACIAFIAVFTYFASEVVERETGWLDSGVRAWAMGQRTPLLIRIFAIITQFG